VFHYDKIVVRASYSPWMTDKNFIEIHNQIKAFTLVGIDRCYSLWSLVEQSAKCYAGASFIEVGVWRGGTGALIASKARALGSTGTVYLCDTFSGVVKSSDMDHENKDGRHSNTSVAKVLDLVQGIGLDNTVILEGIFPEQTAHNIPENEVFRFAHIDVDVYQSAKDAFAWLWPRMAEGGIVVFDDYGFRCCPGVAQCVNEMMSDPDKIVIYNLTGQAIIIKT
jgi:O-methyltransferase